MQTCDYGHEKMDISCKWRCDAMPDKYLLHLKQALLVKMTIEMLLILQLNTIFVTYVYLHLDTCKINNLSKANCLKTSSESVI